MKTLLLIVCSSLLPQSLSLSRIVIRSLRSLILISLSRITLYLSLRLLAIIRKRREVAVPLLMLITLFLSMIRFFFEVEPDQGGLTSVVMDKISDNSTNGPLLELPEFESFHFDPSFPRPPSEPPDVEICLNFEPDADVINNFDKLDKDECFDPRRGVKTPFLTPASPLRACGISSGWNFHDFPDFEASCVRGFCPSFTRASNPQLHFGNPISKSYRLTFVFEHT
ncbi:hypothetical protein Tco_1559174 [Tanacetum coccineum]